MDVLNRPWWCLWLSRLLCILDSRSIAGCYILLRVVSRYTPFTLASLVPRLQLPTNTTLRYGRLPCIPPGNKPCLLDLEFCVYT